MNGLDFGDIGDECYLLQYNKNMSLIPILADQLRLCTLIRILYNRKHRLQTRTIWTTNMACEDPRARQPSLEQLQPPPAALVGAIFTSRTERETKLNGFASTQGYAMVVARSKKRGGVSNRSTIIAIAAGRTRTVITSAMMKESYGQLQVDGMSIKM